MELVSGPYSYVLWNEKNEEIHLPGYRVDAPEYVETHLYDLQTDPYELKNIIDSEAHVPVKAKLKKMLLELMQQANEPPAILRDAPTRPYGQRTVDYPGSL